MTDSLEPPLPDRTFKPPSLPFFAVRRRFRLLKWLVPAGMVLLVVVFELGPSRWIHNTLGFGDHLWVEILFYGTVGPVLAYVLLDLWDRWLEERETSDLQAAILIQARERARLSLELSDGALQTLFAASALLSSLKSNLPDLPPEAAAQLANTERALDQAIRQLHAHLLNQPDRK